MRHSSWFIFACDHQGFWICNRFHYGQEDLDHALEDCAFWMNEYQDRPEITFTVTQTQERY